jgi:branched-chain amino acid transport system ATP-binding protein
MPLLEVIDLVKRFGRRVANNHVSFYVEEGEIVGMIGPEGAGKTTLANAIVGYHKPDAGKVIFNGVDITGFKPFVTNRVGIARTFQVMKATEEMTVLEHVMVGAFCRTDNRHLAKVEASAVLGFLKLDPLRNFSLRELSPINQKKVGLARTLATQPELLLLDEITSGLNLKETEEMIGLFERINKVKKITLLIIEHKMEGVTAISKRVVVLAGGEKVAEGNPKEIITNERVLLAYGLETSA